VTLIYHLTHVDNLLSVARDGILCDQRCQSGVLKTINSGHRHIKERRARHTVPCGPGGVLADYAPFYFAPRAPMLYAIYRGNVEGATHGQGEMVHLVASCEAIRDAGLPFAFTDGHAIMMLSNFYDDLRHLSRIDWAIMVAEYWNDRDGTGERPRKRQAEFLVHSHLPWSFVEEVVVHNRRIAQRVQRALQHAAHRPPVTVRPEWYY
jgi:hypothetical protein